MKTFKIKYLLTTVCLVALISSCKKDGKQYDEIENSNISKKGYYQQQMRIKQYQLLSNGPCDDALEDTLYTRNVPIIESSTLTDSKAIVEFKFKEACCQEFMGHYTIKNDTLIFTYEQVNEEVCECICWYRYKLMLNTGKKEFKTIKITSL
ncbi:hypothetical protein [Tamlana flava]|uniref:hypothetical protein n=1 Tax=Tamlana flava TaxID=3158572 RepID=UPI00351BB34C